MLPKHSSDQKLRDFRPPYLTKSIIIREYLNLGKLLISFFRIEMIQMKLRYFAQIQVLTYDDSLR